MPGTPVGTIFAELDLDASRYTNGQQRLLKDATTTSLNIEENFKKLGVKSAAEFDLLRQKAKNAFDMIAASSKATADDIVRAERAKNETLRRLNEQQYGHQTTIIENLKNNWIKAAAAIGAAMIAAQKGWTMLKAGAEYDEQAGILNNLAVKYKTTADSIVADMKRASEGMIANSDLMQIALGGIAKGLTPKQLTDLADASRILADTAGGTATEALNKLTESLETGRVKGLKNYAGGTVELKDSFGDLESQLTATEKAQAMYSLIMIHATQLQKEQKKAVDDTADTIEKVEAKYKDLGLSISRMWKAVVVSTVEGVAGLGTMFHIMFGKKGATGPGVYEVPPIAGTKEDPLAEYKKQIEELKKLLQARKDAEDATKKADRDAEAAERAAKRLMDQWEQTIPVLQGKIKKDGLEDFEQKLIDIQTETDKLIEKFKSIPGAIALINAAGIADIDKAVTEQARKDFEEIIRLEQDIENRQRRNTKIQDDFYQNADPYGQKAHDARMAQIQEQAEAFRRAKVAEVDILKWVKNETLKYEAQIQQEKLSNIASGMGAAADAFAALSQLYAEDSKERKVLHDISMAFAIAEKAALAAQAVQAAVIAVATQGTGDPYTAFARIASMAAAMAALLAQIGVAFNAGSGSSASAPANPVMGNSTVLGAAYGAASESIPNSMKLLEETYDMQELKLTKIHNELRNLNSNITGLVSSILRTTDIGSMSYGSWVAGQGMGASAESAFLNLDLVGGLHKYVGDALGVSVGGKGLEFWASPLTYLVNNLLGSIVQTIADGMFGGKVTYTIGGVGIEIGDIVIGEILNGVRVSARKYTFYKKTTEGGWFGEDENQYGMLYDALDESVIDMFSKVFNNLGDTLVYLAESLGTDVSDVYEYVFKTTRINLMGKTGEEMAQALTEYFSKIGDEAARDLFGEIITQYQQLNEGLLETAIRLVRDKEIVKTVLEMTGQSFSGTIPEMIRFSETLIQISGGLEKLTDAMQTYYDAFFSDAEKQMMLEKQLMAALAPYGLDLPGTRAGYRALVESLDLTTEAGMHAYNALLQLSKVADQYYDYMEGRHNESDYASREDYYRATRGFANGGISTGPDSGYEATLHGTELIVSPKSTYPARVNGIGSEELVSEVRKLRTGQEQINVTIAANQARIARLLDQWDGDGIPPARAS